MQDVVVDWPGAPRECRPWQGPDPPLLQVALAPASPRPPAASGAGGGMVCGAGPRWPEWESAGNSPETPGPPAADVTRLLEPAYSDGTSIGTLEVPSGLLEPPATGEKP